MKYQRFHEQFAAVYELGLQLARLVAADAIMLCLEGPTDWKELRERAGDQKILIAVDKPSEAEGAAEFGLQVIVLEMEDDPVYEKLTQALLESVAEGALDSGARVVAIYSGFEVGRVDSISYIRLDEHLGRLTVRDLRDLTAVIPLETLKAVVDLAIEIGREGREGKPVGTMFVVGDARKVLAHSRPAGFDPVKGYSRRERNLKDGRVREGIKEVAQMDGAFVVAADGTVEASCRIVESTPVSITLSKGLGSRHWAAAAITKTTRSIAVVVSETNGTVRIFQNGEVRLRIEPFRRAMKWRDFEYEPPSNRGDDDDD